MLYHIEAHSEQCGVGELTLTMTLSEAHLALSHMVEDLSLMGATEVNLVNEWGEAHLKMVHYPLLGVWLQFDGVTEEAVVNMIVIDTATGAFSKQLCIYEKNLYQQSRAILLNCYQSLNQRLTWFGQLCFTPNPKVSFEFDTKAKLRLVRVCAK